MTAIYIVNPSFVFLCLSFAEFPSQSSNDSELEVRKSRAAVIATEPIPETVDIARTRVKKTARSVIVTGEERISLLHKPVDDFLYFP